MRHGNPYRVQGQTRAGLATYEEVHSYLEKGLCTVRELMVVSVEERLMPYFSDDTDLRALGLSGLLPQ